MTLEDAFHLIKNLDVREGIRSRAPQWSTVVVGTDGYVIEVIRYRGQPTDERNKEHILRHPMAAHFTAWPERFESVEALAREVERTVEVLRAAGR